MTRVEVSPSCAANYGALDHATGLVWLHRELNGYDATSIGSGWHAHRDLLAASLDEEGFSFASRYDELVTRCGALFAVT